MNTKATIGDKVLHAPEGIFLVQIPKKAKASGRLSLVMDDDVGTNHGAVIASGDGAHVGDSLYFINRGFETTFSVEGEEEPVRILSVKKEDAFLFVGESNE